MLRSEADDKRDGELIMEHLKGLDNRGLHRFRVRFIEIFKELREIQGRVGKGCSAAGRRKR